MKSKKCAKQSYDDESDKFTLMKIYLFLDAVTVSYAILMENLKNIVLETLHRVDTAATQRFDCISQFPS